MGLTWILVMCVLWPWPCKYDLGSGSWHALGSWTTIVCELLSRSNLTVRSYGPDTDLGYASTLTFTLEIWPWSKVMAHPWVMDDYSMKYYSDPIWQWEVMVWTRILGMCALWRFLKVPEEDQLWSQLVYGNLRLWLRVFSYIGYGKVMDSNTSELFEFNLRFEMEIYDWN